jgi:hypothetical protein
MGKEAIATARVITFWKSWEYWLVPLNMLLEVLAVTGAGVLAVLDKELLTVPICKLQGRIEPIVLSGPKL